VSDRPEGQQGSGQQGSDQVRLAREALAAVTADARAKGVRPVPSRRRPAEPPADSALPDESQPGGPEPGRPEPGRPQLGGPEPGESQPGRPARRRSSARPGFAAQPHRDDPRPLSAAIGGLLDAEGWALAAATGSVFGRWAQIVGADLAAHTTPETLTDGELTVSADSTAWATQVRLLAAQLIKRLNAELGHGTVLRVRVRGPVGSTRKPGEWRVRGGRGPRDTYG
jgi:predicted nucleic acid-binding Zn ribbon protein